MPLRYVYTAHCELARAHSHLEIRLQFLNILRKLSSSQSSIARVVGFAIKHANKCADDLWEVLGEECGKANLNARINIFYCLDNLLCDRALRVPIQTILILRAERPRMRMASQSTSTSSSATLQKWSTSLSQKDKRAS